MNDACASCGGATAPGTDLPPCLCTLLPVAPETKGGRGTEARALRCPGCGGWLETGVRRCTYCSIAIAAVRCWRCFELAFAGSSSCAACGAKLGLEGDLGETERTCLSCPGERLHLVEVGDHRVEECMRCGAVFVGRDTLESLTRARELDAGERVGEAVRPVAQASAEVRYRGCPACGVLMNRRNFGRRSGVIVDVCKEHGVWFDADELTAVLEFVARGGLVKQRQTQLEEAQRRLSQRRMDALMQQHRQMPAPRESPTVESAAALIGSIMEIFR